MLEQKIMSFLKGLVGPLMLPAFQATQASSNPLTDRIDPMVSATGFNDDFFHPLLGSIMTCNEHDMLTKLLKLKPMVLLCTYSDNTSKFIQHCYERLHRLGVVHQHVVDGQAMVEILYGVHMFYFTSTYLDLMSCFVYTKVRT